MNANNAKQVTIVAAEIEPPALTVPIQQQEQLAVLIAQMVNGLIQIKQPVNHVLPDTHVKIRQKHNVAQEQQPPQAQAPAPLVLQDPIQQAMVQVVALNAQLAHIKVKLVKQAAQLAQPLQQLAQLLAPPQAMDYKKVKHVPP